MSSVTSDLAIWPSLRTERGKTYIIVSVIAFENANERSNTRANETKELWDSCKFVLVKLRLVKTSFRYLV